MVSRDCTIRPPVSGPAPALTLALLYPLAAALVTFVLLAWMLRTERLSLPLDHPNERSLHHRPIPRTGGIAIFTAAVPVLAVWSPLTAAMTALLAAVSFIDDKRGLPISLRFAVHGLAALGFALAFLNDLAWPLVAAAVVATMWMINLYNFMDGSDGLAGGMALFGFGAYAVAAWLGENHQLALAASTLCACSAAFLCFNFHPARVFLGDAGSVPFGFLAATLGIIGWQQGVWPLWFPLLVFSPFIVDASVTLVRRILRGERFWQAHRSHYYQRLVQLGWGHRKTALAEYALMIACASIAVWALKASATVQAMLLVAAVTLYLLVGLAVDRAWKQHQHHHAASHI